MKNKIFLKIITLVLSFILVTLFLLISNKVFAETFYCVVKKDVDIPFEYHFFSMKILAQSQFEIELGIVEAYEEEALKIKFVTGEEAGDFKIDGGTMIYYLGDEVFGATKTDYEILGPEGDENTDIGIPAISALFMRAKLEDQEDWDGYDWDQYTWDTNARITKITISANNVRIKYINFLNDEGEAHEESEDFGNYDEFDETDWENLTLTTGDPFISTDSEILHLRVQPTIYPYDIYPYDPYRWAYSSSIYPSTTYTYSPYSYSGFLGSYQSISPWTYPGSNLNSYSGISPYSFYNTHYSHFPSGWNSSTYFSLRPWNASFYTPYNYTYTPYNYNSYNTAISVGINPFSFSGSTFYSGGFQSRLNPFNFFSVSSFYR